MGWFQIKLYIFPVPIILYPPFQWYMILYNSNIMIVIFCLFSNLFHAHFSGIVASPLITRFTFIKFIAFFVAIWGPSTAREIDKSKKNDRQDKLPVCTYLPSIILYSINVRYPTSEYFPIRECSDTRTIMSRIA